ncbi:MAG: Serine/threonine-protein kinase [Cirrosporium novae-zelandiae]|nr:MAG: Serine/threonine-protein kinase [Cirrosporium novae-zelandiae]
MGQGYSVIPLPAGSAGIDVPELSDLVYEKSLGTARFMKSIRARRQDGLVVVKVVMKPYAGMSLRTIKKTLEEERRALLDVPNALCYQRTLETEEIEKKWLSFQLLCALRDCHSRDIFHGDIKSENILVTSWNWLYLTDFSSSYKPPYLPEDNPADFSFYFDISGRRTCYLAPERFLQGDERPEGTGVNWAMDVFSAGCVIAELFLEAPIFSLSQLFKYRKKEYEPEHVSINKIEDEDIRELVLHMIKLEPESRYSAEEYLNFWRRKAFPEYFYSFLHQYMGMITDASSAQPNTSTARENPGVADDRIERVYLDFDKIAYFLGYDLDRTGLKNQHPRQVLTNNVIPTCIDLPHNQHLASANKRRADDGTLIFLTLVASSLRNAARATAKVRACDILLAFAERLPDEAKLDRVLPYIMTLLNDRSDIVRGAAIRTLTQLMSMISVVSPVNAYVFSEYILPRIETWKDSGTKPNRLVRAIYASCMAPLARCSMYFLDIVQALRADGSLPTEDPETEDGLTAESTYRNLFDVARIDLIDQFEGHTKALLTDSDSFVRRAFLGSVSDLLAFFGSTKADDIILSHLNTYLNDKDWILKCAFFEIIVGVATFIGSTSLEEYILPLLLQALTDPEEFVVEKVIRSFARMAELGLFQPSRVWELMSIVNRFTMHPNIWIREAAADFSSSAVKYVSAADKHCIALPLLKPYLKIMASDITLVNILDSLNKPFPRAALEMAILWATKAERGTFWKSATEHQLFSMTNAISPISSKAIRDISNNSFSNIAKNDEDKQWVNRLRNMGMTQADEWKLCALMVYIWRMAKRRHREDTDNSSPQLSQIIPLKEINVTPQTVFFDSHPLIVSKPRTTLDSGRPSGMNIQAHSITDALLDASTSIDDPLTRRKRTHTSRKSRDISHRTSPSIQIPPTQPRAHSSSQSPSPRIQHDSDTTSASPSDAGSRRPSISLQRASLANRLTDRLERKGSTSKLSLDGEGLLIRHRNSAINLLNKKDTGKADAEIGTTSEYAFGKVDGSQMRDSEHASSLSTLTVREPIKLQPTLQAVHDYSGTDPSVLAYLDSVFLETNKTDVMEFGPLVQPINLNQPIQIVSGVPTERPWRPELGLVSVFGEHTGPINRVLVAPDHAFFITASDDGTVKVWDSMRLERNVTPRSRQTHKHAPGAKVKCICFIENTHSFLSCGSDGSIHAIRVEFTQTKETTRYGKLGLRRDYQLPEGEYSVWIYHYRSENASTIICATNRSRILAIDLRTMSLIYALENPVRHGIPTCFVTDEKHTWLLLSTSHGVLNLWDLRFCVRIRSWSIPSTNTIHRLVIHPYKGHGKWVCVAGGGNGHSEITVWDVEKTQCREVYRLGNPSTHSHNNPKHNLTITARTKNYEPEFLDDSNSEGMLNRFATALEPAGSSSVDRGILAMAVGLDAGEDSRPSKFGFLITGGSDRKVRYWDLFKLDASLVVSGLDFEEGKPKFEIEHPSPSLTVLTELRPPSPFAPTPGSRREPPSSAGSGSTITSGTNTSTRNTSNSSAKRMNGRPSRSTVISQQQQQLLKNHLDEIMDVAFLRIPYGMCVSVDRSGMAYIFQ